jgi:hypothetical protein
MPCSSASSCGTPPRGTSGDACRAAIDEVLADAGAVLPVEVKVVPAIEREPGHAAKVKLVVSEALEG